MVTMETRQKVVVRLTFSATTSNSQQDFKSLRVRVLEIRGVIVPPPQSRFNN